MMTIQGITYGDECNIDSYLDHEHFGVYPGGLKIATIFCVVDPSSEERLNQPHRSNTKYKYNHPQQCQAARKK
jgi:hypothetical protein